MIGYDYVGVLDTFPSDRWRVWNVSKERWATDHELDKVFTLLPCGAVNLAGKIELVQEPHSGLKTFPIMRATCHRGNSLSGGIGQLIYAGDFIKGMYRPPSYYADEKRVEVAGMVVFSMGQAILVPGKIVGVADNFEKTGLDIPLRLVQSIFIVGNICEGFYEPQRGDAS